MRATMETKKITVRAVASLLKTIFSLCKGLDFEIVNLRVGVGS